MSELDNTETYKVTLIPQVQRYYNEETFWGVFVFTTNEELPKFNTPKYRYNWGEQTLETKESVIAGKMQALDIGEEYTAELKLVYNEKFHQYQYEPVVLTQNKPKTVEQKVRFLKSILTENQAQGLIDVYPDIVDMVMNGKADDIDLSKVKGIGDKTFQKIKNKIIANYCLADILALLQPFGITYNQIMKIYKNEQNAELLKQKLHDNPYEVLLKIHGFGFIQVDKICLKINPELKKSKQRVCAYIKYFFDNEGNDSGHTWVYKNKLNEAVSLNVPECAQIYKVLVTSEQENPDAKFLYFSGNKVGLKMRYNQEKYILDKLVEIDKFQNTLPYDLENGITNAEDSQGFKFDEGQLNTIEESTKHNVVLTTGRAGTGKSSILRGIIHIYSDWEDEHNPNLCSIAACALSAKAAQRIAEATGLSNCSTIHRLLGAQGEIDFCYNKTNPLPYDIIILDEASMVNVPLFCALMSAIKPGTKLIITGDVRQLPPIGYGNVFYDLLNSNLFYTNKLTTIHRQAAKSGIIVDANKVCEGISPIESPEPKIIHGELGDMYYIFKTGGESKEHIRNVAIKTYLSTIEIEGIDNCVIITPRKKDCVNSSKEINKIIQSKLLPLDSPFVKRGDDVFYLNAKVMQIVNDYDKKVFNGMTGYITRIFEERGRKKFIVDFNSSVNENENVSVCYTEKELGELELAYSFTIHKSQGSGYKTVIIVVDSSSTKMLDNCLLYTGITRAKQRCLVISEPDAFHRCISKSHSIMRQTWIPQIVKDKLNENQEVGENDEV